MSRFDSECAEDNPNGQSMAERIECAVIGGGVVGLAIARRLAVDFPDNRDLAKFIEAGRLR